MAIHEEGGQTDQSRRTFIRRVGKSVLAISVVDIVFGHPRTAYACGEGVSDATCGTSYSSDANCGVSGDPDNNCGPAAAQSNDMNCGGASSGGAPVGGPSDTDVDEACASNSIDDNCSIGQNPTAGHDVDQSCTASFGDGDNSCGDCNDNHENDENCGVGTDPDDLCGHQHLYGFLTEDAACSATVPDVGCGDHDTSYSPIGLPVNDPDQHCVGTNTDMNCSAAMTDENCNAAANPSTTSPDENCSDIDYDEACNMYDQDQSCGSPFEDPTDEACGITVVPGVGEWPDTDGHCVPPGDPDNTDDDAGTY